MVPLLIYLFIGTAHTGFVYGMQCEQRQGFEWQPLGVAVRVGVLWPVLIALVFWSHFARDRAVTRRCERICSVLFGVSL